MKKEDKRNVGRPRLADSKLKKESVIVSTIVILLLAIISVFSFNILSMNFNYKDISGSVRNNNLDSCMIKNNLLSCGPNVTHLKYKLDNNDYVEVKKEYRAIKMKLDNYNNITYCYNSINGSEVCNK